MPAVSVVMSVLRPRPAHLREALRSVLAGSTADLEVVVLEDPPHGAVAEALAEVGDARVRHERSEGPTGLAESRNRTLALARAPLVAVMDADDICAPDRLERQVRFLGAHPEVAVVGGQIAVVDQDGALLGYRSYPLRHESIARALRRYNCLAHPSVMFRRQAVLDAGGYRSRGGAACDDYELWSRMACAGHRFANLPDVVLRYRLHAASMKARLVRETLRDTLWIKRQYWSRDRDLGDRLRVLGERILLRLPPPVVGALFRRHAVRRRLRLETAR